MPLMPFFPLFLLKLQAWMDHRQAAKQYLIDKQFVDVTDITELLEIAVEKKKVTLKGQEWLPSSFLDAAKTRVIQYTVPVATSRLPDLVVSRGNFETLSAFLFFLKIS